MTHTTKHTPGLWVPYNSDKGRIYSHWYIRVDSGPTIVTVHNGLPDNQDMGNARLIAAAPAMYEALQLCKAFIDHGPSATRSAARCKEVYDNALAQAEGTNR